MRSALLLMLSAALASAASLPVAFEPNRGQEPGPAEFLVRTSGAALTLRAGRAEWISRQARVAVVFESTRRDAQGQGEDLLPGVVNYLIGNQPSAWHKNIPTYSRVRYRELYPGVDVVYYVKDGRLEYDVELARGADPSRIRLRVEGAQSLRVDEAGDLVIATAGGELRQHRPIVYQESNGERRQVAGRYQLRGREVRFVLGRYDRSQSLVIDPALTWATYLMPTVSGLTTSDVQTAAVALDSAGNIYLAGSVFVAAKFNYCFVAKLNPSGTTAAYVTLFGSANGDGDSDILAIAVSSAGNIYVAGTTDAPDFDADTTYLNYYPGESVDGFVMELNNTASAVIFSHYFGGSGTDMFYGVALDSSENVYLVGTTNSPDLLVGTTGGTSPAQTALRGPANAFVVEFSAAGSLIYSTYLGGTGVDNGVAIAADSGGDAFVTGSTTSANFPTAGNPYQSTLKGTANAFVAKIAPNTGTLVYSTYLGGRGSDAGNGIVVDPSGAAFITGGTSSSNFPVFPSPGAYQATYSGSGSSGSSGSNAFVTRLAGSGSSLLYSTYLGGSGGDIANAIAIDSTGNAYITGTTTSTNFPISNAFQDTNQASSGIANAFVAGLNASGTGLLFSSYLGGNAAATLPAGSKNYGDSGTAVALNCAAGLVVAGITDSTNLPATGGTVTASYPGGAPDAFVAQIAAGGGVPDILAGGIANNGMAGPVAPGAVVSIYGTGLAPFTQSSSGFPLPTSLAGVSVTVNGVQAPMYFASSGQINIQLPFEIPAGPAAMTVSGTCGSSGQVSFEVAQTAPYIVQSAGQAILLNQNNSVNGPTNPAKTGTVAQIYLTGIGPVTNQPADGAAASLTQLSYSTLQSSATATISGWTSTVQFLGLAPGWVGLDQANLVVPVGLSTGAYPVVITVNGVESNGPTMYVTQ
jgi:uncharacterized protein (TIGR03437 family)